MRWGVLILLGVFFVSFASAAVPDDCPVALDMISYWQFEDNALDGFDKYNGSWSGAVPDYYDFSDVGKGASFSGGEMITISNVPALPKIV